MQGNITDWGKEVKKGLIERGWSINDLAERIGKSRTRVSGVVNGRIYSDSIASAISDLLNIEKASASMKEATRDWCMDARKAMIDLDMNTGELAEKTGYSTQYLNAIICGRCYSPPVMKVISGALGIQEYQGNCQDNGMYYEPSKPNYPLVIVLLLMAGIFWPLVILFAVFVPLTFLLMDKMGQLHPKDDDEMDPEEDTYL